MIDWSKYPNFRKSEFDCSFTGRNEMKAEFLDILQKIRTLINKPMIITSGYRDKTHPREHHKAKGGTHTLGVAADISVRGADALKLIWIALDCGIQRIGVNQKGDKRFIHLDIGDRYGFNVSVWTY